MPAINLTDKSGIGVTLSTTFDGKHRKYRAERMDNLRKRFKQKYNQDPLKLARVDPAEWKRLHAQLLREGNTNDKQLVQDIIDIVSNSSASNSDEKMKLLRRMYRNPIARPLVFDSPNARVLKAAIAHRNAKRRGTLFGVDDRDALKKLNLPFHFDNAQDFLDNEQIQQQVAEIEAIPAKQRKKRQSRLMGIVKRVQQEIRDAQETEEVQSGLDTDDDDAVFTEEELRLLSKFGIPAHFKSIEQFFADRVVKDKLAAIKAKDNLSKDEEDLLQLLDEAAKELADAKEAGKVPNNDNVVDVLDDDGNVVEQVQEQGPEQEKKTTTDSVQLPPPVVF